MSEPGRPIPVELPAKLVDDVIARVGPARLAAYIVDATLEKLQHDSLLDALVEVDAGLLGSIAGQSFSTDLSDDVRRAPGAAERDMEEEGDHAR